MAGVPRLKSVQEARASPIPVDRHAYIPLRCCDRCLRKVAVDLALVLDPRAAGSPDRSEDGEAEEVPEARGDDGRPNPVVVKENDPGVPRGAGAADGLPDVEEPRDRVTDFDAVQESMGQGLETAASRRDACPRRRRPPLDVG